MQERPHTVYNQSYSKIRKHGREKGWEQLKSPKQVTVNVTNTSRTNSLRGRTSNLPREAMTPARDAASNLRSQVPNFFKRNESNVVYIYFCVLMYPITNKFTSK